METTLKIEELAQFVLGIFAFSQLNYAWWLFPVLLLTPDIGMLGYIINPKIGAFTYNVFHHKAVAVAVGLLGFYFNNPLLILIGVILFSHASFDRVFGYGLKYPDSFKNTHLGSIGK
ncbi:MAG: DUF4260 domain-containing protein [Aequorivita sp.]|nr:DUF4260 domain-containing protein [Aequorivita sp.]